MKNQYVIHQYYRDKYKSQFEPKLLKIDQKVYKSLIGKEIDNADFQEILNSLTTSVYISNLFEQVDTVELKKYLTDKQIELGRKRF